MTTSANKNSSTNTPRGDTVKRIIQCPQCDTKFAVDSSLIDESKFPRFHCSRCDNVFGLEVLGLGENHAESIPTETKVAPQVEDFSPSVESSFIERQNELEAGQIPLDLSNTASGSQSASLEFAEPTNATLGWLEADRDPKVISGVGPTIAKYPSTKSKSAPKQEVFREIVSPQEATAQTPQIPLSRWRSVGQLLAPLACTIIVLFAVASYFASSPQTAAAAFRSVFSHVAEAPPSGVALLRTSFRKESLDSGESIYLISGTIANRTTRAYQDIKIEVAAFDASGTLISKKRVLASPVLAKSHISSLTLDMIEGLQNRPPRRLEALKPGDKVGITVALNGSDLSRARYFSAQIYSVKESE